MKISFLGGAVTDIGKFADNFVSVSMTVLRDHNRKRINEAVELGRMFGTQASK